MQYVVGIDPSVTNTGVVVLDTEGNLVATYESSTVKKRKKLHANPVSLYADRAEGIVGFLKQYAGNILCACYEGYSYGSTNKSQTLAEFGGILKFLLLTKLGLSVKLIPPMQNKKFGTGNGASGKDAMIEQATKEAGFAEGVSSDICDAYFLAKYAWYYSCQDKAIDNEQDRTLVRHRVELVLSHK